MGQQVIALGGRQWLHRMVAQGIDPQGAAIRLAVAAGEEEPHANPAAVVLDDYHFPAQARQHHLQKVVGEQVGIVRRAQGRTGPVDFPVPGGISVIQDRNIHGRAG